MIVQSDGKIVAGSSLTTEAGDVVFVLNRYNQDGRLDTSFGPTLNGFDLCGCPEGEGIVGLSFNGSTLFGVTAVSDELITINVGTGLITDIGPAVGPDIGVEGLAFTAQVSDQVPEPGALLLTASGIAVLIARRRLARRRRASR